MAAHRWQDRPPAYRLRQDRNLSPDVRALVREFVAWFAAEFPARHALPVLVYDCRLLMRAGDETQCRGMAWLPNDAATSRRSPIVYVAGRQSLGDVLDVIAHELAHYRGWVERGDRTERGKRAAERALVARFLAQSDRWEDRAAA